MPFGLQNTSATYQWALVTLFHDMMHKEIEVYVDDMIAKSHTVKDRLVDLRKLSKRLIKYRLRLNHNKCFFGASSGKLLGFIVSQRGIEVDPAKVQAIWDMPTPRTEKQIRSFLGKVNYIGSLHSAVDYHMWPIVQALEEGPKDRMDRWVPSGFDKIKQYLLNPPILIPPTPRYSLILYLAVQKTSIGCMLGQVAKPD